MERKIGEIFEHKGEWYQCVEGTGCYKCDLYFNGNTCTAKNPHCACRSDWKNVVYKKLEKVGEPYEFQKRIIQTYKLYTTPFISANMDFVFTYLNGSSTINIIIKQNKEDMEEKKDNYDGNMDKECIQICDALNSISDVHTTESCCGHCKDRFMVFFTCNNPHSLAIIARVFDRRYIGTSQPWYIELQTNDSGAYYYFIHSETKYDSEEVMMKDINQIIENIKYWCDDKFASHFKGCDDKPTLAPFDINLAKQGKPVCTRDGRKARIICFDRIDSTGCNLSIVALIQCEGTEVLQLYRDDGKRNVKVDLALDLMMLPEKKEGWVNVYKRENEYICENECNVSTGIAVYKSEGEAKRNIDKNEIYVNTIKITWEE